MALKRFGVSLEDELLEQLDALVKEDGYANRSQAIRFLIEKNLAEKKWQCNHIVAGTIFKYMTSSGPIYPHAYRIYRSATRILYSPHSSTISTRVPACTCAP